MSDTIYNDQYRKAHLADFARNQKKYREAHPDRIRSYAEYWRKKNANRFKLINFLGGICCKCPVNDERALQLDHKNGGGTQEWRKFGGHTKMIVYYLNHLDEAKKNLQVLCSNCNLIKKYELKEFGKKFI